MPCKEKARVESRSRSRKCWVFPERADIEDRSRVRRECLRTLSLSLLLVLVFSLSWCLSALECRVYTLLQRAARAAPRGCLLSSQVGLPQHPLGQGLESSSAARDPHTHPPNRRGFTCGCIHILIQTSQVL